MRIAIHDFGGYPFTAQLARALANRGHDVLYLHAEGLRKPRGSMVHRGDDPPRLALERVGVTERIHHGAGPRRFLQERRYAARLAEKIARHQPDVVIGATGSLDIQAAAQRAAHTAGAAFAYWLQDVNSVAIERLLGRRVPSFGRLLAARFARLERALLRRSEAVISITPDFGPLLHRWGVDPARIFVVPNWAPLDEIAPRPRSNSWAQRHRLGDVTVFLYAGTLGRKHEPELLVRLADAVPSAMVVVVAEGVGTDRLRGIIGRRTNVMLLPLQPASDLPDVLASADVLVALLEHDAGVFSVPSKILTYLAAGRPILAAIPPANLAARTIQESGAGRVVDPSDADGWAATARELSADGGPARAAAGAAARAYAEQAFDIEGITDQFESILEAAERDPLPSVATATDTGQ